MRLIDADELAHDLEYDVELCARALDDMNVVGKEREDMQWQKDCKQNCIWYISEQPTVDAVPVVHGHWKYGNQYHWYRACCSECGYCRVTDVEADRWNEWKYCPNCGTRMDQE